MQPHEAPKIMVMVLDNEISSAEISAVQPILSPNLWSAITQTAAKPTLTVLKMITGNDAKNTAANAAD
jgi:hypothetical protein